MNVSETSLKTCSVFESRFGIRITNENQLNLVQFADLGSDLDELLRDLADPCPVFRSRFRVAGTVERT